MPGGVEEADSMMGAVEIPVAYNVPSWVGLRLYVEKVAAQRTS
jgi:hypothetical protein